VQVVVLDNLREGVLAADIYDPALNQLYRDVLAHYGVVALPVASAIPIAKAKWSRPSPHPDRPQGPALRDARGGTGLSRWLDAHWADTRIHGTTKRQVAAMFAEERPPLQPPTLEPFRYYPFGRRTVHPDNCIEVDARGDDMNDRQIRSDRFNRLLDVHAVPVAGSQAR
jgi:hypothetical protein